MDQSVGGAGKRRRRQAEQLQFPPMYIVFNQSIKGDSLTAAGGSRAAHRVGTCPPPPRAPWLPALTAPVDVFKCIGSGPVSQSGAKRRAGLSVVGCCGLLTAAGWWVVSSSFAAAVSAFDSKPTPNKQMCLSISSHPTPLNRRIHTHTHTHTHSQPASHRLPAATGGDSKASSPETFGRRDARRPFRSQGWVGLQQG